MRIAVFSSKPHDRQSLAEANRRHAHVLEFFEPRLTRATSSLASGFDAICPFVGDSLSADVLAELAVGGVRLLTLRSAGLNHVDLAAAAAHGIAVARVPASSPYAVAERAVRLLLTLNRKFHRAYLRVREGNFALEGLLGFDLHGKTVGVVGTGKIGAVFCRILLGFGCRIRAFDVHPDESLVALGVAYVSFEHLLAASDVVALHLPLTPATHHLIDVERSNA